MINARKTVSLVMAPLVAILAYWLGLRVMVIAFSGHLAAEGIFQMNRIVFSFAYLVMGMCSFFPMLVLRDGVRRTSRMNGFLFGISFSMIPIFLASEYIRHAYPI